MHPPPSSCTGGEGGGGKFETKIYISFLKTGFYLKTQMCGPILRWKLYSISYTTKGEMPLPPTGRRGGGMKNF